MIPAGKFSQTLLMESSCSYDTWVMSTVVAFLLFYFCMRRKFLVIVAESLLLPQIRARKTSNIPRAVQGDINTQLQEAGLANHRPVAEHPTSRKRRRRCCLCSSSKDRKSQQVCYKCHRNVCREHNKNICICDDCQSWTGSIDFGFARNCLVP